jgi:uncharacterized protein YxeA
MKTILFLIVSLVIVFTFAHFAFAEEWTGNTVGQSTFWTSGTQSVVCNTVGQSTFCG